MPNPETLLRQGQALLGRKTATPAQRQALSALARAQRSLASQHRKHAQLAARHAASDKAFAAALKQMQAALRAAEAGLRKHRTGLLDLCGKPLKDILEQPFQWVALDCQVALKAGRALPGMRPLLLQAVDAARALRGVGSVAYRDRTRAYKARQELERRVAAWQTARASLKKAGL